MTYTVKEVFYTLQGEGMNSGRAAVFCRFAGCNLWTGREEDRSGADCTFCDTDFVGTDGPGGGKFKTPEELAHHARNIWNQNAVTTGGRPLIVCTGGEPLLQLDIPLIKAFQAQGFEVAVETNGTIACPVEVDWICVSPKRLDKLVQLSGHELKLVYPQDPISPQDVEHLDFNHFLLQPMDEADKQQQNTKAATAYCLSHPKWKLCLQTHKILGIA